ncbi:hypothetical protein [Siphonobacter curvatus]|uniref:Uncharacterized protein n=1 Tax=Siphonobacter curvatus TaxID=2094562 RepID=A0A2S7IHD7_9BACT|nr:hypothetical protein [Siphonobacter curvatus]PQA55047.1 hypothetical protein C5O19_21115 [Siphonobacter curvatus]
MKRFLVYATIALLLNSCTSTKNWQGSSTPERTQAEFKELNGTQNFTLRVPDNDTYLAYQFKETGGELEASIQSPSSVILNKKIDSLEEKRIHLVNQKGAEYKVTIKGKQASGAVDVRFVDTDK